MNKKMKTNKIIILLFVITMGMMTSCETTPKKDTNTNNRKAVDFSTVEGVKSGIEGTVWTYTEPLTTSFHIWMRLEFKGGKAYVYTAVPSDGTWGTATVKNYIVKESRDVRTGERQVVVEIDNEYNKFVPKTGWFVWFGIQSCTMEQRDYSWD